ncbi:MAG TPA: baseplate protein [Arcobacter sp.]|nr:baseplate protein [Arcobacter sp.]
MIKNYNFLGEGVSFPFTIDKYQKIKTSKYEENIKESIKIILSTKLGERLMRPNFGCRIHELLFTPNTIDTHNLAIFYVTEALKRWEHRINLSEVKVSIYGENAINISIDYQIKDTNSFYNLVYPFYLTEYI